MSKNEIDCNILRIEFYLFKGSNKQLVCFNKLNQCQLLKSF